MKATQLGVAVPIDAGMAASSQLNGWYDRRSRPYVRRVVLQYVETGGTVRFRAGSEQPLVSR